MIDNFSVKLLKNTRILKQKESNIKLIYWLKGSGKINLDLDTYNMKKRDLVFIM
ncbi:AraC family transcriptional regulator, partial [Staphylococcus hominis]